LIRLSCPLIIAPFSSFLQVSSKELKDPAEFFNIDMNRE
jgi:hypothetical protein